MSTHKDQTWCRKNVADDECRLFWENWCQTQWGMPTFSQMRAFVEAVRQRVAA